MLDGLGGNRTAERGGANGGELAVCGDIQVAFGGVVAPCF